MFNLYFVKKILIHSTIMIFLNILGYVILLESTWLLFPFINLVLLTGPRHMKLLPCSPYLATWSRYHDLDPTFVLSLKTGNWSLSLDEKKRSSVMPNKTNGIMLPAVPFLTRAYTTRYLFLVSRSNTVNHKVTHTWSQLRPATDPTLPLECSGRVSGASASLDSSGRVWPISAFHLRQFTKISFTRNNNSQKLQYFKNCVKTHICMQKIYCFNYF